MKVPSFFVKKVIVKGSFKNVIKDGKKAGFELTIKNKIGLGTLIGCRPVTISGKEYRIDKLLLIKNGKEYKAAEISESMPLTIRFGDEIVLRMMDDVGLELGSYEISTGINLVSVGWVEFSYKDDLKE